MRAVLDVLQTRTRRRTEQDWIDLDNFSSFNNREGVLPLLNKICPESLFIGAAQRTHGRGLQLVSNVT